MGVLRIRDLYHVGSVLGSLILGNSQQSLGAAAAASHKRFAARPLPRTCRETWGSHTPPIILLF